MNKELKVAIGIAIVLLGILILALTFTEAFTPPRPGPRPPRPGPRPPRPGPGPRPRPPRPGPGPRPGPRPFRPIVRPRVYVAAYPTAYAQPLYMDVQPETPIVPAVYVDGGYPLEPGCDLIFGEWRDSRSRSGVPGIVVVINQVGGDIRITTMEGDRKKTQLYNSIKCDGGVVTLTARNGAAETLTLSRTANGGRVLNLRGFTLTKN
jgi:hypothetical protein